MKLRRALKSDFEDLTKVYNESRTSVECFTDPDVSIIEFKSLIEGEEIHLVTAEAIVIGFISVWTKDNFIHHLYVAPIHQNKGVGKFLLNACVSYYGLPLSLKSVISNTAASMFYENNNFVAESTYEGADGPYQHYWLRDD